MATTGQSQLGKRRNGAAYFGALAVVMVVTHVASGLYAAGGVEVPKDIGLLSYFLLSVVLYSWFMGFAAEHRLSIPFEMGLFLYVAWWAIVAFYLVRERRARGLWPVVAFIALYIASYALSLLIYFVVTYDG